MYTGKIDTVVRAGSGQRLPFGSTATVLVGACAFDRQIKILRQGRSQDREHHMMGRRIQKTYQEQKTDSSDLPDLKVGSEPSTSDLKEE